MTITLAYKGVNHAVIISIVNKYKNMLQHKSNKSNKNN
jgi:hypothetical protein